MLTLNDPKNACQTEPPTREEILRVLNYLKTECNKASKSRGWWHHAKEDGGEHLLADPKFVPYVIGTKIALSASEVFEGFEGYRKGLMDDKLPQYPMLTVEFVDNFIRNMDIAGELDLDVAGAWLDKMDFNTHRPDHDVDVRRAAGGKKF